MAEAKPISAGGLQEQIRELSSALRVMHDELEQARHEARELRQELKLTRDQVMAIKSELSSTPNPAKAQEPLTQPAADSRPSGTQQLEQRVAKVEEEQQLQSSKIEDQYQTKVESGSKYRVKLSGMALLNTFRTGGVVNNSDLPDFALPPDFTDSRSGFGASLRQSIIGLDVFGPEIGGAKTKADLRADFFGGFASTPNGGSSPLFRLRTGGLRLDWKDASLVMGQYAPIISPLSPTSLASVAYPALASAGNLWVWTPEIFVERRVALSDGSHLSLQGGLMEPLTGDIPGPSAYRAGEAGESAGQPAYAARVAWVHGPSERPFSLGAGAYFERQNWKPVRIVNAWAGTADWSLPVGRMFSLTGEFYRGRAIGGLGAGEGRSVYYIATADNPWADVIVPDSTGGWAQLKFAPSERIEFNGAFGQDFTPFRALQPAPPTDVYSGLSIGRNQSVLFNTIYHIRSNVLFSIEYRRLRTSETQPGLWRANQVIVSAATLF